MHPSVKHRLPEQLRALVDEIEVAAGCEIETKRRDIPTLMRARPMFGSDAGPGRTVRLVIEHACDIDASDAAYREPFAIFTHELLHLRRYMVERVPFVLNSNHDPDERLENTIEHWVIEQQSRNYGFTYPMNFCAASTWETAPAILTLGGRCQVFDAWIRTDLLTEDDRVRPLALDRLEKWGLLGEALALSDRVRFLLTCRDAATAKIGLLVSALTAFGVSPHQFRLCYRTDTALQSRPIPQSFELTDATGARVPFSWA